MEKSRSLMEQHEVIQLYLDRNKAGTTNTRTALNWNAKYLDQSHLYSNYKDLNEYLVKSSVPQKQGLRTGRHL